MKHVILIILLTFLIFNTSKAQQSIIKNDIDQLWYVTYFINSYPNFGKCLATDIFTIGDEVTIRGILYSGVFKTKNEDLTDWNLLGYLREEHQKVFFLPSNERPEYSGLPEGKEYLIYDFSLEVSDTIWLTSTMFAEQTYKYTVTEIDSIEVDGEKRKRMTLEDRSAQDIWVESIGSLMGPLYSGLRITGVKRLTCYMENGKTVYTNPDYSFCYCDTLSGIEEVFDEFLVYPNPTGGVINIEGACKSVFSLYNSMGQLVLEQNLDETTRVIDVSNQKSGVYHYRICIGGSYKTNQLIILKK